jgi:RNA polymerase sigma factor (sigma-70 family)
MAMPQLGAVVRHIHELADDKRLSEQADGELLRVFLSGNDQAAFEELVRRHGPMVLRVCRRTLGDAHEAEDALQATFLVLARKAASIRKRVSLASWLHGVAYRMANHAKRAAARRQHRGSQAAPAPTEDPALQAAWRELQALLDQEIDGLAEGLRAAFICCCLENMSSAEAAQQLGLQEGTVRMRLSRARKLLQERLSRRGVTLSAALAAGSLGANGLSAAVLQPLAASTAEAASRFVAGQSVAAGLVSTKVTTLAEGVLKTMFLTKLKGAVLVLLAVALAGTSTGALAYRTLAAAPPGGAPEPLRSEAPAAGEAARLARLVEQLGSDKFADRERASKELDQIGAPALDALRKAARDDDPERKRRAEDLIKKIEGRDLEARLLAPKRVRLVYKDTALADAVADFQKQSGYGLTLSDPQGKLKGRKVTLDTGEVTFWQALDQFCRKAGLTSAALSPAPGRRQEHLAVKQWDKRPPATSPTPPAAAAGKGGVILSDGKPQPLPTDGRTAVRVRALDKAARGLAPAEGEALLALEITPEPKLRLGRVLAVRVRKASDDQGQDLEQVVGDGKAPARAAAGGPPADTLPFPPPDNVPLHTMPSKAAAPHKDAEANVTPIRLKKGAKAATSLSELSGTVTIRVQLEGGGAGKSVTLDVPFSLKNVPLP